MGAFCGGGRDRTGDRRDTLERPGCSPVALSRRPEGKAPAPSRTLRALVRPVATRASGTRWHCGWVHRAATRRLVFVDLATARAATGRVQPESEPREHARSPELRWKGDSVRGAVVRRSRADQQDMRRGRSRCERDYEVLGRRDAAFTVDETRRWKTRRAARTYLDLRARDETRGGRTSHGAMRRRPRDVDMDLETGLTRSTRRAPAIRRAERLQPGPSIADAITELFKQLDVRIRAIYR